jgi:Leucine-rich repeat (LRR) protein
VGCIFILNLDWVPDSNFDDICAETVASNLPFLKRLWIYNSPLSDKGSASVCTSLQSL